MRIRTVKMLELVAVAVAGLFLHTLAPALAASDGTFTPEEQHQLELFLLHKTVTANIDLPMTTVGSVLWWDKRHKKWVYDTKTDYLPRFGLGVKKTQRYEITTVEFTNTFLGLWLGDGGVVTQAMVQEDDADTDLARQQIREQRYALLRSRAHGSRIYISFGDYQFDSQVSKLEVVRTLLIPLIEVPGETPQKAQLPAGDSSPASVSLRKSLINPLVLELGHVALLQQATSLHGSRATGNGQITVLLRN